MHAAPYRRPQQHVEFLPTNPLYNTADRQPLPVIPARLQKQHSHASSIPPLKLHPESRSSSDLHVSSPREERSPAPRPPGPSGVGSDSGSSSDDDASPPRRSLFRPRSDAARKPVPRPSGILNLQDALGWEPEKYKAVRKMVNQLVDIHLHTDLPLTKQIPALLQLLQQEALTRLPELGSDYEDAWPVRAFATNHLRFLQNKGAPVRRPEEDWIQERKIDSETGRSE